MTPAASYQPNVTFEHWSMVKSMPPLKLPTEVWKLIIDTFKILSLPTSETCVPSAIIYLRNLTSDKQYYFDYVVKYFNHGRFSLQALKRFENEYRFVIENAQTVKLVNFFWQNENLKDQQRVVLAAVKRHGGLLSS